MGYKFKFTARDLRRFEKLYRGTGTFENYIPWHRVSRSDPSSHGRSHLQLWCGRQRELLSDGELVAFLFSTMLPGVVDIREQFPLNLETCRHELNAYRVGAVEGTFPGTVALADQHGVKYPVLREDGETTPWVMTTDLLVTFKSEQGFSLLAISVKPTRDAIEGRPKELLGLEREYWKVRDVPWILITRELYNDLVADLLRRQSGWAFANDVSPLLTRWLHGHRHEFNGMDLTYALKQTAKYCGSLEKAKFGFWNAVWTGILPLDLRRTWRPSTPLTFLSTQGFWELNPVFKRRTSWPT